MMREDKTSFYTKGYTVHGEWFLDGKRLPRRPLGPAGPAPTSINFQNLSAVGSKLPTEGEALDSEGRRTNQRFFKKLKPFRYSSE